MTYRGDYDSNRSDSDLYYVRNPPPYVEIHNVLESELKEIEEKHKQKNADLAWPMTGLGTSISSGLTALIAQFGGSFGRFWEDVLLVICTLCVSCFLWSILKIHKAYSSPSGVQKVIDEIRSRRENPDIGVFERGGADRPASSGPESGSPP